MGEAYDGIIAGLKDGKPNFSNIRINFLEHIRNDIAGNPYEWFVRDANGYELHIGDKVIVNGDHVDEIVSLGERIVYTDSECFYDADQCEKCDPDTTESAVNDLEYALLNTLQDDPDNARHIAEKFAARFMKLGELK